MKETLGSSVIKARAYAIYQRLAVLSLTHKYYDELDCVNKTEYPEVQQVIEKANQDLTNSAATTTTEVINDIEESVGDDIANVCIHQSSTRSHFPSSLVASNSRRSQETISVLNQTVDALGIDRDIDTKASRSEEPINDFNNNDFALNASFPY
eukprot:6373034-Ditylum_brightwellii.AAC.1